MAANVGVCLWASGFSPCVIVTFRKNLRSHQRNLSRQGNRVPQSPKFQNPLQKIQSKEAR